jgi:hypothetical protein
MADSRFFKHFLPGGLTWACVTCGQEMYSEYEIGAHACDQDYQQPESGSVHEAVAQQVNRIQYSDGFERHWTEEKLMPLDFDVRATLYDKLFLWAADAAVKADPSFTEDWQADFAAAQKSANERMGDHGSRFLQHGAVA